MKKLLTLAAVAAVAVPALISAPANALSVNGSTAASGVTALTPVNTLTARCKYKRIILSAEKLSLKMSGYTGVKYLGTSVFHKRCAQFVRFSACKGLAKYKVTVRYIKGVNRYVIVQRNGICIGVKAHQNLKLKLKKQ